jgi:O-antigen biosynthesis protein
MEPEAAGAGASGDGGSPGDDAAQAAHLDAVADDIVRSLAPASVFHLGCGRGHLVAALWDRGVEARGRDGSAAAVALARPEIREYCAVGAPGDPIEGRYGLVVAIGVVEPLASEDADRAVAAMAGAADRILFSPAKGPDPDPSRRNGRPAAYWLRRFATLGFAPVLAHDATYAGPQAMLLERTGAPVPDDLIVGAAELISARVRLHRPAAGADGTAEDAAIRHLEQRMTNLVRELRAWQQETERTKAALEALESTRVLRYSRLARRAYGAVRRQLGKAVGPAATPRWAGDLDYERWIAEFDQMDEARRRAVDRLVAGLLHRPLISVLVPVYDTPERYLREAIESVLAQRYPHWELCLVDDCSTAAWVPKVLEEYGAGDDRVRVVRREENGHISAASNTGVAMARGEWVVLLDHDDTLAEHALAMAALAIDDRPDAGLLYSDEDKIDDGGRRSTPFFKPEFDPLLLLAQNYLCHMTMLRTELVRAVGGFREGLEGSQDWDLVLRATEQLRPDQVVHVPHVLYHWRVHPGSTAAALGAKPYAIAAGRRAVSDHLARRGQAAEVTANDVTGVVRVRWPLPDPAPKVSVIVPTRDGTYLEQCLQSLFSTTAYPDFEVVVVDNGSVTDAARQTFERYAGAVTVLRDERPFNFSALNNAAAARCNGDVLCLMNDDCEVTDYGWLEEMVSQLLRDGVGVVGAKLLYPDGLVQHAGVVLGIGGVAGHVHRRFPRLSTGYFGWLQTPRSLSAVTAACMVVRRSVYDQLGGLDETNLSIAFNDIDFCLRAGEAGWRVVWTPHAVLTHHESVSRGFDDQVRPVAFGREVGYMQRRWAHVLRADPAYNLNLTLEDTDCSVAFPPRVSWWVP